MERESARSWAGYCCRPKEKDWEETLPIGEEKRGGNGDMGVLANMSVG